MHVHILCSTYQTIQLDDQHDVIPMVCVLESTKSKFVCAIGWCVFGIWSSASLFSDGGRGRSVSCCLVYCINYFGIIFKSLTKCNDHLQFETNFGYRPKSQDHFVGSIDIRIDAIAMWMMSNRHKTRLLS